ncbi:MAG: GNAT family N-acetyltransferase [Sphingosinicella sp.]
MFARTRRLLLRPGWREDAPALFRAIADERIVRNLGRAPWPYAMADAEQFLARELDRADEGRFLIFLRSEGAPELIGGIGFGRLDLDEVELGYWIARPHWGRGFATEAGRAVIDIVRNGLRLKRLIAGHFTDNPASGRVLAKLGFQPSGGVVSRYSAARGRAAACRLLALDFDEDDTTQVPSAIAA